MQRGGLSMSEENRNIIEQTDAADDDEKASSETDGTEIAPLSLSGESLALIEKIIAETDEQKVRDLTYLFNANQNKKTMVRVNKLSDLLDTITDQALTRFTMRPDEISNKELFDGLKIVQDLIDRGQKQVSGVGETPLIQVNQQTNEVNIGTSSTTLSRDSRERVKSAVLSLLNNISAQPIVVEESDAIVIEPEEETKGGDSDV
jgi:hypothetical protein